MDFLKQAGAALAQAATAGGDGAKAEVKAPAAETPPADAKAAPADASAAPADAKAAPSDAKSTAAAVTDGAIHKVQGYAAQADTALDSVTENATVKSMGLGGFVKAIDSAAHSAAEGLKSVESNAQVNQVADQALKYVGLSK